MNDMNETKKISPKDVFLHILAIAALWASAISFIGLIFQYIDRFIPDALYQDGYGSMGDSIRWSIAVLTVIFPVFLYVSRTLDLGYAEDPEKRNLKTRKWLLYFTLFATGLVIIGDLVTLIYNFLNGDLSLKFVLKIITVLFAASVVFGYYLWNIKNEKIAWRDKKMRFLVWLVIIIVGAATISGYFVAGSPFRERMRKFDERRINDLQSIQWQIVNYWQRKEKLPDSLENLTDDISGFSAPRDPETGSPYEYQKLGDSKFQLCADFKMESSLSSNYPKLAYPEFGGGNENWSHGIGQKCFERSIDPDLYPSQKIKSR